TGRAVARVARETGRRLAFGGPATAFPDPVYLGVFLSRFRDRTLPLDFVSWHWYGNDPFFGPDGQEPIVPPTLSPVAPVLNRRNPPPAPPASAAQGPSRGQWPAAAWAGGGRGCRRCCWTSGTCPPAASTTATTPTRAPPSTPACSA